LSISNPAGAVAHATPAASVSQVRREARVAANLFFNLLARNLKTRYRGSVLGVFWTLLNPALMLAIYTVVFSKIVRINVQPYPVFLLAGLLPWTAFSQGISTATVSLLANAPIVKKVYFRLELLPIAEVATAAVNLLISLGLVIIGLLVYRGSLDLALISLPLLVAIQVIFTAGLGLALAAATSYFRDVEYLTGLALLVLFYASPIIYPANYPSSHTLRTLLQLNPMTWLMTGYQDILFHRRWPDMVQLGKFALFTAIVCSLAWIIYRRVRPHLPEEL